jgi:hypothetical protein
MILKPPGCPGNGSAFLILEKEHKVISVIVIFEDGWIVCAFLSILLVRN